VLAAIPLTAVALSAQNATGTGATRTRANVNVIRQSDSTSPPPAAAPAKKDDTQDHTVFWRGNGGYVGNIAGAGTAIQSGGSPLPPAPYTQSYGSSVNGGGYVGVGYVGGGRGGRRGSAHTANSGGLNPATNNSGIAPGQTLNPATNNSGIAPGQTAGQPYHPPTAYGVTRLPLPKPKP
jgi:hypothetical protein